MTAAAAAAHSAPRHSLLAGGSLVVLGGLVEGLAVAIAQLAGFRALGEIVDESRYVVATLVVAGLGWGAGAVPSVAVDDPSASSPPLLLVGLGGAALGLGMGVLMGAAQGWALRVSRLRPSRWVRANAVAWTPVMAIMMLGASTPDTAWPLVAVLPWAALVGAVAGGVLGAVLHAQVSARTATIR